jgi:outer membrane immunogenic protein
LNHEEVAACPHRPRRIRAGTRRRSRRPPWFGKNNLNAIFPAGFVYNNDQRGLGSITGRIGYSWGPGLVYFKGGYAYADNRETLTFAGAPVAFTLDRNHNDEHTLKADVNYRFNWAAPVAARY